MSKRPYSADRKSNTAARLSADFPCATVRVRGHIRRRFSCACITRWPRVEVGGHGSQAETPWREKARPLLDVNNKMTTRTRTYALVFAVAAGIMMSATPSGAAKALSMAVSPRQTFAPANLFIRLDVTPDAENRAIEVVADSGSFYRSSRAPLEGDRAPRIVDMRLRDLPGGDYDVTGILIDSRGQPSATTHIHVSVLPSGEP
jgi:hypothetical protein